MKKGEAAIVAASPFYCIGWILLFTSDVQPPSWESAQRRSRR